MALLVTRDELKGLFLHAGTGTCPVCKDWNASEYLVPVDKEALKYKDATSERIGQLIASGSLSAITNPIWCKCTNKD